MDFFVCFPLWAVSGSVSYYFIEKTRTETANRVRKDQFITSMVDSFNKMIPSIIEIIMSKCDTSCNNSNATYKA